jgi:hypothetical protein
MKYTLLIEKIADDSDNLRAIVFETDDTGDKSVCDIVETTREGGYYLIAAIAEQFVGWEFSPVHAGVDFGRARTDLTRIRKVVEQLDARLP